MPTVAPWKPEEAIATPNLEKTFTFYWIVPCTCRRGLLWKGRDRTDLVILQRGKWAKQGGKNVMINNPNDTFMGGCTRYGCLGRWRSNLERLRTLPDMDVDLWKASKGPWLDSGGLDHVMVLGDPRRVLESKRSPWRKLMGLPEIKKRGRGRPRKK